MKTIRFDGPTHVLQVGSRTIRRGAEGEVPNAALPGLLAHPRYRITVLSEGEQTEPEADGGEGPNTDTKEEEE